jgi:hypothetical protein
MTMLSGLIGVSLTRFVPMPNATLMRPLKRSAI